MPDYKQNVLWNQFLINVKYFIDFYITNKKQLLYVFNDTKKKNIQPS